MELSEYTPAELMEELSNRGINFLSEASDWDVIDEVRERRLEYEFLDADKLTDTELLQELDNRGYDNGAGSKEAFEQIVQLHRCGELTIEGKGASELINQIYSITNKVV